MRDLRSPQLSTGAPLVRPAVTTAQQVAMGLIFAGLFVFWLVGFVAVKAGVGDALAGDGPSEWIPALLFGQLLVAAFPAAAAAVMQRRRRLLQENRLRAANPREPWRWRTEWGGGVVREVESGWGTFLLVAAVAWNVLAAMVIVIAVLAARPLPLLMLSPAIGVLLLALVVYERLRVRRYGRSTLRLDACPIVPGTAFRGELLTRGGAGAANGFSFRLTCVHERVIGHGRDRMNADRVVWSEEQVVGPHEIDRAAMGVRVPFTFTIPAGALETDDRLPRNAVRWMLRVHAGGAGIDYRARFELPVFDPAGPR